MIIKATIPVSALHISDSALHIFDEYVNHSKFRCHFEDCIASRYYNKWILCIHDKTHGVIDEITHIIGDIENHNFTVYLIFNNTCIIKDGPIYDLLYNTAVEYKLRN